MATVSHYIIYCKIILEDTNMEIMVDEETIELLKKAEKKVGAIATYDISDMEDVLMWRLLTRGENNNMELQERIRISRLIVKPIIHEYIQIINHSEFLAEECEIPGLTEKDKNYLENEIRNSIRRILIEETNEVNIIISKKIHEEMGKKELSIDERISMVDELYFDTLREYRRNNSNSKQINESVEKLVEYYKKNLWEGK